MWMPNRPTRSGKRLTAPSATHRSRRRNASASRWCWSKETSPHDPGGWNANEVGGLKSFLHCNFDGRPASQGCIRVPAAMNRFLDRHGVLDADIERAAQNDPRYRNLLPLDRESTPLAGRLLVVIDSAEAS